MLNLSFFFYFIIKAQRPVIFLIFINFPLKIQHIENQTVLFVPICNTLQNGTMKDIKYMCDLPLIRVGYFRALKN